MHHMASKVGQLSEDAKKKIQEMSQKDMPLEERRMHYNALARRFKKPAGLKPGLLEKYAALAGHGKERFEMLKAFLIDPDMTLGNKHVSMRQNAI